MAQADVVLLTRVGCHLCDDARDSLSRIADELGVAWREEDVDSVPSLRAEYGDRVPVVLIDRSEHSYWRIDEKRLRAALSRL